MDGVYFDEKKYEEYLRELIGIFMESKETDSIILEFYVNERECKTAIKRINEDASQDILSIKNFEFNEEVKQSFLIRAIAAYILYNEVFTTNVVSDNNDSSKNTIKIVTSKNDMFNINGLTMELANQLLDEITVINEEKKKGINRNIFTTNSSITSEAGVGNPKMILLTIIVIGMTVIGTLLLTIFS